MQISLRNLGMTHCRPRSVNKLDMLHARALAKATLRKVVKKADRTKSNGLARKIMSRRGWPWFSSAPRSLPGGKPGVSGMLPGPVLAFKQLWVGNKIETARFFHCYKQGVHHVFVDHPMFLEKVWGKMGSKIYGPMAGLDYKDNQLRLSLLCQTALEAPRVLNLISYNCFSGPYGENVVFIANDWHTALLPCCRKTVYQSRGIYMNAKAE